MIKAFFKDGLVYAVGNFLVRGIAILLLPIYTHYLSPKDYGLLELYLIINGVFAIVSSCEISQGLARYYADTQDKSLRANIVSTGFWFAIFSSAIFAIVLHYFASISTSLLDTSTQKLLSSNLVLSSLFFNSVLILLQNQLRWRLQPTRFIIISLLYATCSSSIALYYLIVHHSNYQGIILGNLVAAMACCAVTLLLTRDERYCTFSKSLLKKMLAFSLPLIPSSLGIVAALYTDRVIIKQYLSITDLGLFGVAYRFATIATLFIYCFQVALAPLIYHHYQKPDTKKQLAKLFDIYLLLFFLIVLGLASFNKELILLFTTPAYTKSASLIPLLAASIFISNLYLFFPGFVVAKKTKLISIINLSNAVLNIFFNLVLIHYFGLIGSAIGTLLSTSLMAAVYCIVSSKHYQIKIDRSRLLSNFLFFLGTCIAVTLLSLFPITLAWHFVVGMLIYFSLALFFVYRLAVLNA